MVKNFFEATEKVLEHGFFFFFCLKSTGKEHGMPRIDSETHLSMFTRPMQHKCTIQPCKLNKKCGSRNIEAKHFNSEQQTTKMRTTMGKVSAGTLQRNCNVLRFSSLGGGMLDCTKVRLQPSNQLLDATIMWQSMIFLLLL
jgi:hypothetical protein